MKESLRKAAEGLFPEAKVVVERFHVITDPSKRIEQDVFRSRKVRIPRKIFLIGREKLSEEKQRKVADLLDKHPGQRAFIGLRRR